MSNRPTFVSAAPAPSAVVAARSSASAAAAGGGGGAGRNNNNAAGGQQQGQKPSAGLVDDPGQLVAMQGGPRLNPHSALKEFNAYLLQVLEGNDEEKRQIIARLRLVVQAQRSAAAVRDDLQKMTMEFNETQRTAEELRLALQESREAQRRLEHENRVLAAQVEDDRAKIAALVKLCRAEIASGKTGENAQDILLSIHQHGKQPPGHGARVAQQQQSQARSAARGQAVAAAGSGSAQRQNTVPSSAQKRSGNNNNANTSIPGASGVTSSSSPTAMMAKTASLRDACSQHGVEPAFHCPAGDGDGQEVNANTAASAAAGGNNNNNNNRGGGDDFDNETYRNDIVAQVLTGTAPSSVTGVTTSNATQQNIINNLRMEVDALRQLLDEQRAAYEASRAAHVRVARDCDRRHYEEAQRMAAELRSLSDLIVTSTKDLCETRQNANVMQRQLRGEIEGLVQRLAEAEKTKSVQSARQTEELRVLACTERNKNAGVTDRIRTKLSHFETKLRETKDTAEKEISQLKEALATSQETSARERRQRLRAEEHARLKAQGAESDLGLLRAQLRTLEKKAFFAHAKELTQAGMEEPLQHAPTEIVDVEAPLDDNEALDLHFDGIPPRSGNVDLGNARGVEMMQNTATRITTAPPPAIIETE